MRRFILAAIKYMFLSLLLVISLEFFLMNRLASWLGRNYRVIIGTDPIGARQVVQGTTRVITWFGAKVRGLIGDYIRRFHPRFWRKFRDQLRPRR